jgi:hypothetical protein
MIILGDSHVRSFSYSCHTFPVFLSSGKNLLLNNEGQIEKTIKIISNFLSDSDLLNFSSNETVYLLIGEPSLRFFIDSKLNIDDYAEKYIQSIRYVEKELLLSFGVRFVVFPPVPRCDKSYSNIWLKVIDKFKEKGSQLGDIFDSLVDGQGSLLDKYVGDYIHANEKLADHVIRNVIGVNDLSSNKYKWNYFYGLSNGAIWGEANIDFLCYSGSVSRDFDQFREKSLFLRDKIENLNYCSKLLRLNVATDVSSEDEGFWACYSSDRVIRFSESFDCFIKKRRDFLNCLVDTVGKVSQSGKKIKRKVIIDFCQEYNSEDIRKYIGEYDDVLIFSKCIFLSHETKKYLRVRESQSEFMFCLYSKKINFVFLVVYFLRCRYEGFLRVKKTFRKFFGNRFRFN